VVAGASESAVAGARVRAGEASTVTDPTGRFVLSTLPNQPAVVQITVSAAGYLDQRVEVALVDGRGDVHIVMVTAPEYREDVVVTGRTTEVTAAPPTLVLEPLTVNRVAGSADNVFRVLQTLPGVTATDDFGSRLTVRGGGPDENLTVMDGVEIHNPYRLFGLTSAFNPETIDRFELTAGGFGVQHGDRLSSILLVDNRAGTTDSRAAASATLSATDANVVLEGRLPSGSWLVTGRRTYYDLIAERITANDLPSFDDLQTKVAWNLPGGRHLSIFGLRSRESTDATFSDSGAGARIGVVDASRNDVASIVLASPLGRRAASRTILSWYRYRDALAVDGSIRNDAARSNAPGDEAFAQAAIVFDRSLGVRDISVRQEINVASGSRHTINTGVEAHALHTDWGWVIIGDRNSGVANGSSVQGGTGLPNFLASSAAGSRAGVWLEDEARLTQRWRVAGGARVDWSRLAEETIVSPRVRTTFDVTATTRARFAAGLFTQSPGYEKLLQSDYFVDLSNPKAVGLKSERAVHWIGGVEHRIGDATTARVEGYFKTFDRSIVGGTETPEETATRVAQYDFPANLAASVPRAPQITSVPTNGATGRAYGFDVYVEKQARQAGERLSGWIAYTVGRATRRAYGYEYPFDYDRRHSLSVVSTFKLKPRYALSTTLRLASGFPFTPPIGVRVDSMLAHGDAAGTPRSLIPRVDASGRYVWATDYGDVSNLNSGRLPLYARLDLRLTYMRSPASRWQLYLETLNALNRKNASSLTPKLDYDPASDRPSVRVSPEGGFPLLPSFGFRLKL